MTSTSHFVLPYVTLKLVRLYKPMAEESGQGIAFRFTEMWSAAAVAAGS